MQAPAKSACSEREGVGLRFAKGGYVACRLPKQAKTVFFLPYVPKYLLLY